MKNLFIISLVAFSITSGAYGSELRSDDKKITVKTLVQKIIDKAEDICAHSGGRLTEKRKRILELLLHLWGAVIL